MTRLIDHHCEAVDLDPLAEAVAQLDFFEAGQFDIIVRPSAAHRHRPARLDRAPDALAWFTADGLAA